MAYIFMAMSASTSALGVYMKKLDNSTMLKNGQAAQKLNVAYQTMNATDACIDDSKACIYGAVASCRNATWVIGQGKCSKSQQCFALPSTQEAGTIVTCTTQKSAVSAIEATGAKGGIFGNSPTTNSRTSSSSGSSDAEDDAESDSATVASSCTPSPKATTSPKPTPTLPASRDLPTVTATITRTQMISKATVAPSITTHSRTVTLTMTVGDQPTTLAAVTRTLSPEKASKLLSRLMAHGATIIDSPSYSLLSS
ncbi:hypothetical protein H0H87_008484 [Tephrocybe sp. NHM501043]|nr:hypothetical protein H0H87_008484 [Tephrocybe sp. NHM501043]